MNWNAGLTGVLTLAMLAGMAGTTLAQAPLAKKPSAQQQGANRTAQELLDKARFVAEHDRNFQQAKLLLEEARKLAAEDPATSSELKKALIDFEVALGGRIDGGDPTQPQVTGLSDDKKFQRIVGIVFGLASLSPAQVRESQDQLALFGNASAKVLAVYLLDTEASRAAWKEVLAITNNQPPMFPPSVAAQALVANPSPAATEVLAQAFASPDPTVRMAVVKTLDGQKRFRPLLEQAAKDPVPQIRTVAISALLNQDSDPRLIPLAKRLAQEGVERGIGWLAQNAPNALVDLITAPAARDSAEMLNYIRHLHPRALDHSAVRSLATWAATVTDPDLVNSIYEVLLLVPQPVVLLERDAVEAFVVAQANLCLNRDVNAPPNLLTTVGRWPTVKATCDALADEHRQLNPTAVRYVLTECVADTTDHFDDLVAAYATVVERFDGQDTRAFALGLARHLANNDVPAQRVVTALAALGEKSPKRYQPLARELLARADALAMNPALQLMLVETGLRPQNQDTYADQTFELVYGPPNGAVFALVFHHLTTGAIAPNLFARAVRAVAPQVKPEDSIPYLAKWLVHGYKHATLGQSGSDRTRNNNAVADLLRPLASSHLELVGNAIYDNLDQILPTQQPDRWSTFRQQIGHIAQTLDALPPTDTAAWIGALWTAHAKQTLFDPALPPSERPRGTFGYLWPIHAKQAAAKEVLAYLLSKLSSPAHTQLTVELYPEFSASLRGQALERFANELFEPGLACIGEGLRDPDMAVRQAAQEAMAAFRAHREAMAEFDSWTEGKKRSKEQRELRARTVATLVNQLGACDNHEFEKKAILIQALGTYGSDAQSALPVIAKALDRFGVREDEIGRLGWLADVASEAVTSITDDMARENTKNTGPRDQGASAPQMPKATTPEKE